MAKKNFSTALTPNLLRFIDRAVDMGVYNSRSALIEACIVACVPSLNKSMQNIMEVYKTTGLGTPGIMQVGMPIIDENGALILTRPTKEGSP